MFHRMSIVAFSALVLGSTAAAHAEPAPAPAPEEPHVAPGLAQGDNLVTLGAEVGWGQAATVSYERTIYRFFGVRAGYSAMLVPNFCFDLLNNGECEGKPDFKAAHGPSIDLVFRTLGEHAFEASAGATVFFGWGDEAIVMPNLFLGYRYQPEDSPVVVRVGAGTKGLVVGPIEASVGFRF